MCVVCVWACDMVLAAQPGQVCQPVGPLSAPPPSVGGSAACLCGLAGLGLDSVEVVGVHYGSRRCNAMKTKPRGLGEDAGPLDIAL